MRKLWKVLPIFLLTLTFAAAARAIPAQSDQGTELGQASQQRAVQGELVKVDTDNQTLIIKQENGEEMQFQYNSNTKVIGRENGVQGLSGDTDTRLTVHYMEVSWGKIATTIEINKKESSN